MRILITGVAGFIGSRLAEWIINNHPEVRIFGLDDLSGGYRENVNKKIDFYEIDVADRTVEDIFKSAKPDIVYHLAAYAAEGLSPFIRTYNYTNNLIATARIVNACINHKVKRLVFTSTMAVYGNGKVPFDESDIPMPIDPYGVAKFAAETDIMIAGVQHKLDWCIIRPHNVYGTHQNIWDKYRNVLGIWIYQHLNGQPMSIFGDGNQTRAFSYIGDSVEPLWNAGVNIKASQQIINLGGTTFYSINEANEILREIMGGGEVKHHEYRHEVKNAYATFKKSIDLLEYKDKTDLKTGLTKMYEWAKVQPKREQRIWDNYEIDKNIYKYWKLK